MADNQSIYCPNCRRNTSLSERSRYSPPNAGVFFTISECNSCDFFVLVRRNSFDESIVKVYPDPLPEPAHEKSPAFLKRDLEEANLCFAVGAYRAASVMARRALQSCCIDKGAPDKRLQEQINWLLSEQVITKDIKDWADEVRFTGNDAAHPPEKPEEDENVSREDAEDMLGLLKQFVNVLYVAPALAEERRQKRSNSSN